MVFNKVFVEGPKQVRSEVHLASSQDGLKWTEHGAILPPRLEGADVIGYGRPCVLRLPDSAGYVAFVELVAADFTRSIGMARSKDGRQWTQARRPAGSSDDETTSSVYRCLDASKREDVMWDAGGVKSPFAMLAADSNVVHLYYEGLSTASSAPDGQVHAPQIGLATCSLRDVCDEATLPRFQRVLLPVLS